MLIQTHEHSSRNTPDPIPAARIPRLISAGAAGRSGSPTAAPVETLGADLVVRSAIQDLAGSLDADVPTAVLTAFLATLHRYTGQDTLSVGVPTATPDSGSAGVRVLPLVVEVPEQAGFAELLAVVGPALADLAQSGSGGGTDWGVGFVPTETGPHPGGQVVCFLAAPDVGQAPAAGRLEFSPATFDADSARRWRESMETVIINAARTPQRPLAELALLSHYQALTTAARINGSAETYHRLRPLQAGFEDVARLSPDRLAVESSAGALSYGELDRQAQALARRLRANGIGTGDRIGVCMQRSPDLLVALLGVLKASAAFVPLDPTAPAARLAVVVGEAAPAAVLIDRTGAGEGPEGVRDRLEPLSVPLLVIGDQPEPIDTDADDEAVSSLDDIAYVYFTSGSTGRPKGVLIDHRCAAGRLEWLSRRYRLQQGQRVLHKTPMIFDIAIWEIFGPLTAGATVLMADPHAEADVAHLSRLMARKGTVFTHFVPPMLRAYLDLAPSTPTPDLRWVQTSGDALPGDLLAATTDRFGLPVHNLYGQTETSEVAGWEGSEHRAAHGVPIGRQIGIYRLFVLDEAMQLVPPGVPGELCVAGVGGLARGYQDRPDLTAERFVPHPHPVVDGERLYRTGDRAEVDADGQLVFLGRTDQQTKIRGCRVEPGEVQAVLQRHQDVKECAVVVGTDPAGEHELIAYAVGPRLALDELARHAEQELPSYMLPEVFVRLDALPRTAAGKLDRLGLPTPTADERGARSAAGRTADETGTLDPLTEQLLQIWREVLGVPAVSPEDSFFEIGGNSLKCLQVLNRVSATFEIEVSIRGFFADPCVRGLAKGVQSALVQKVSQMSEDEAKELLSKLG